jgi:hypothetical protein
LRQRFTQVVCGLERDGMSAHGAPVRNRQNIPFKTRRSSTRFTPRTFVGSNGWITDHSKSDKSNLPISSLPSSAN